MVNLWRLVIGSIGHGQLMTILIVCVRFSKSDKSVDIIFRCPIRRNISKFEKLGSWTACSHINFSKGISKCGYNFMLSIKRKY